MNSADNAESKLSSGLAAALHRHGCPSHEGMRFETVASVVLAGGMSRRMGGGDKTLLKVGEKSLIAHALARLHAQTRMVAINANGDTEQFTRFSLPVIRDSIEGRAGPLAGILAGMDWAAEQSCEMIVTVAGDTPFFPPDLADRLVRTAVDADKPIAIAASRNSENELALHPTFGLWPVCLREDLRKALSDGVRKVVAWADKHGFAAAEFERGRVDPFFNINTREDLEFARELLSRGVWR